MRSAKKCETKLCMYENGQTKKCSGENLRTIKLKIKSTGRKNAPYSLALSVICKNLDLRPVRLRNIIP